MKRRKEMIDHTFLLQIGTNNQSKLGKNLLAQQTLSSLWVFRVCPLCHKNLLLTMLYPQCYQPILLTINLQSLKCIKIQLPWYKLSIICILINYSKMNNKFSTWSWKFKNYSRTSKDWTREWSKWNCLIDMRYLDLNLK